MAASGYYDDSPWSRFFGTGYLVDGYDHPYGGYRPASPSRPEPPHSGTPMQQLIAGFRYKPGWQFSLVPSGTGPGEKTLYVTFAAPDSTRPGRETKVGSSISVPVFLDDPLVSHERRCRWLLDRLQDIERHEIMEFFDVDGHKPFFPHGNGAGSYDVVYRPAPGVPRAAPARSVTARFEMTGEQRVALARAILDTVPLPSVLLSGVTAGTCGKGPGCDCKCEPEPHRGCKNGNHCGTCSSGCHVNCDSLGGSVWSSTSATGAAPSAATTTRRSRSTRRT